jgi:hypothetical protein
VLDIARVSGHGGMVQRTIEREVAGLERLKQVLER